ncbi:hypothetical protein [Paraburkholderia rhynchosiae]|uniref:Uncharacterized protein n=1 Tax=Paraburkholderia rhynchosiae TaxID=487049 RepID=A0A2N7VPY5_9BURK|nr:hypothetical protein [Paraburkholderia rhynchosiae]PMS19206.1 hypothetical protein C0Z16_35575 [Paraburkholderia rhynchosiae]CAB3743153.1 hypothetical protein LMG27174_06943 [Paraburkholderia rhynchosiae]
MQIDSALPSTPRATDRATKNASSSSIAGSTATAARAAASNASEQDDAVHISTEGAAAAAQAQDGNTVDGTGTADSTGEGASASDPSVVKSFAYGTLGLERPDQPHEERNAFYTAGRWLAAGITLGGIISLLI